MLRASLCLVAALVVPACSLIVSTDGLADGPLADAPAEAGIGTGNRDAGTDGGTSLEPAGCPDWHGLSTTSSWPTLGGCPSRIGRTAIIGPASSAKVTTYVPPSFSETADIKSYAGATVGPDGTIYLGVEDDTKGVRAFTVNGSSKWSGSERNSFGVTVAADGDLYAASGRGVSRVDPASGAVSWRSSAASEVDVTPLVARNGDVYWAGLDGTLGSLRPDGVKAWEVSVAPAQKAALGGPALGPSGLICLASDGALACVEPSGTVRWRYAVSGATSVPVIDSAENIYLGAGDGSLHAVSAAGERRWSVSLDGGAVETPALGRDRTLFAGTEKGAFAAVSASGVVRWRKTLPGRVLGQPLLDGNDTLYVTTNEPAIYALAAADGAEVWRATLPAQPNRGLSITPAGALLVALQSASIRAFAR